MGDRRGYFGIGIENNKFPVNIGTLWRTATNFGATFIFTVGDKYKRQVSDTPRTPDHKPLLHWATPEEFIRNVPDKAVIVGVEIIDRAADIVEYEHPERAIYVLGSESGGLTEGMVNICHQLVHIPMQRCANVAVAGGIVMYDRYVKRRKYYREEVM